MIPDGSPGSLPRRRFVGGLVGAWAAAAGGCQGVPHPGERDGFIDTHTHFYDPRRPQGVPWPGPSEAGLYRPVLPEEYERLARPLGMAGTVVVEASPWVEDNQWVLDLVDRHPFLLGLVGNLSPGQPGFGASLARFSRHPRFRGIRTGLGGFRGGGREDPFVRDLAELARRGLSLDLLIPPAELPQVASLAKALPELPIIIDHCANVPVRDRPPAEWARDLAVVSRCRNVHLKVSGLVEGTGARGHQAPADPAHYRPWLEVVDRCFGEDRVIFGSNWPVSDLFASLPTVVGIVREHYGRAGRRVAARYFRQNAIRFYGLGDLMA